MLRNHTLLSILCATVLLSSLVNIAVSPVAEAVPRPGDLEEFAKSSPETLVVEVISVKQSVKQRKDVDQLLKRRRRDITVAAEVKVLRVEKSQTRLRKDDRIVIKYTILHPDDTAGTAGAYPPIIVEQGIVYKARLERLSSRDKTYSPYAYSESFMRVSNR